MSVDDIKKSSDIEYDVFAQILEMDDDEHDRDFSRTIVFEFFQQAENTIKDIENTLYELSISPYQALNTIANIPMCYRKDRNLGELSSLGHFLKGSSATLGLTKIKDACEAIQHLGAKLNESGTKKITDPQECLNRINNKLDQMRADYKSAKETLEKFYK